jgi:hypothetical protein
MSMQLAARKSLLAARQYLCRKDSAATHVAAFPDLTRRYNNFQSSKDDVHGVGYLFKRLHARLDFRCTTQVKLKRPSAGAWMKRLPREYSVICIRLRRWSEITQEHVVYHFSAAKHRFIAFAMST